VLNIKIIGSNNKNGIKLRKMVMRASKDYDGNVTIELLDDMSSKRDYKVKNLPGLVINNKTVSEGRVPSVREIYNLMQMA